MKHKPLTMTLALPYEGARVWGLTVEQVRALAVFYETQTGKDAISIAPSRVDPPADPDFTSPNVPEGYDTVLGHLSRHLPHILDLMEGYAEATQRDGWWLKHRCRERNIIPVKVRACNWLVRQGIFEVNAYPKHLLLERFPVED